MNQDQEEKAGPESIFGAWMKATTDFWGTVTKMWQPAFDASQISTPTRKEAKSRPQELWDSTFKTWQAIFSALGEPETMDALSRGIHTLPDIVLKMAQTGWEGYFHLQQQWLNRLGKIGDQAGAFQFENLDKEVFKSWLQIYQNDFSQFLNIPQLGLTRFYQERVNRAMDKFNLFQIAGAEFLYLLYLPVEKSLRVIGEKLLELSKEGNLSDDLKEYYSMWIKILEGHYMTLFKSPDYTQALHKALSATEDFMKAKEELLTDALKTLPIPTNQDMDEVYKELYLLKKRVKELEKKVDKK